jgi:hypothetical protein
MASNGSDEADSRGYRNAANNIATRATNGLLYRDEGFADSDAASIEGGNQAATPPTTVGQVGGPWDPRALLSRLYQVRNLMNTLRNY